MFVTSHIDAGEAPRYTLMWGSFTHFLLSEDNSSLKFGGTTIHHCLSVMLKVMKQNSIICIKVETKFKTLLEILSQNPNQDLIIRSI